MRKTIQGTFRIIVSVVTVFAAGILFTGCETVKPYEKEYLLHPLMDDGVIATLNPTLAKSCTGSVEKLAGGPGGGGGTACPTCGG